MSITEAPMSARPRAGIATRRTQTLAERAAETALRPLERDASGVRVNPFLDSLPTPERLRHGEFVIEPAYDEKLAKAATAKPITHARTLDTLGRLLRARVLDERQALAGWTFHEDFTTAGLDALRAANLMRVGGGRHGEPEGVSNAREKVRAAMARLGRTSLVAGEPGDVGGNLSYRAAPAHVADAIWFIVGIGENLKEFSRRALGPYRVQFPPRTAVGLLIGGLTILAG